MARARSTEDTFALSFIDLLSCMMGGAIILFLVFSTDPSRGSSGSRPSSGNSAGENTGAGRDGRPAALWIDLEGVLDRRLATAVTAEWFAGSVKGIDRGLSVSPPLTTDPLAEPLVLTTEEREWAQQLVHDFGSDAATVRVRNVTLDAKSEELLQSLVAFRRALPSGASVGIDSSRIHDDEAFVYVFGDEPTEVLLPQPSHGALASSAAFRPGAARQSVVVRLCMTPRTAGVESSPPENVRIRATVGSTQLCWSPPPSGLSWSADGDCIRATIPLRRLKADCA